MRFDTAHTVAYNICSMAKQKRTYHHGDLRAGLIAETIKMIGEGEFSKITMRQLAERLSVSRTAPYRHFSDKEALLVAVAEEGFLRLCERIRPIQATYANEPKEQLIQLGVEYMLFAIDNGAHYKLMFGDNAINYQGYPKVMAAGQQAFRVLLDSVRLCQQAGVVRDEDSMQLTYLIWASGHGFAKLVIAGHIPAPNPRKSARWVAETICRGVFTPPLDQ